MKLALRKHKDLVVEIMTHAFWDDPQISWIVGEGKDKAKRMKRLMSFSFEKSFAQKAVYITDNEKAAAVWLRTLKTKMTWHLFMEYLKFIPVFGIKKISAIGKLEKSIQANYDTQKPFIYLWVLGTLPNYQGMGLGSELLNSMLEEQKRKGVDVYLETSKTKNVSIYNHKGFSTYHTLEVPDSDQLKIFLMKKAA